MRLRFPAGWAAIPIAVAPLPVLAAGPSPAGGLGGHPDGPVSPRTDRLILAVEDTLDLTGVWRIDPLEARAERLRIGEIVRRCIEREEELRERIETHVFTQTIKTTLHVGGYGNQADRLLVQEEAARVHLRRPGEFRSVPLMRERYIQEKGERKEWKEEDEKGASVGIHYRMFDELPFYLEDKGDYDFRILSRQVLDDRVIYKVGFRPKSDFAVVPEGTIWVDTSTFQILREEFHFGDRVPVPIAVRSIGPFIRERQRIGDLWVWSRILARIDLRLGWMRRFDKKIPDTAEIVVVYTDHRVNEGWPAALDVEGTGKP